MFLTVYKLSYKLHLLAAVRVGEVGGGGGWEWKIQNRTTHVQTNIPLIHLLAGVGVGGGRGGGWGCKVQNRITHVQTNIPLIHLLVGVWVWVGDVGREGVDGDGKYKTEQPMYKPTLH